MTQPGYDFVQSTFRFFIILGQRPGEVIRLAVWQVLLYAVLIGLIFAAYWPLFTLLITSAVEGVEPSEQAVLASLGAVWLGASISLVGGILVSLMIQGAWLRLLTHGETKPGVPFRLGGDEGRLFGVNLVFVIFNVVGWGLIAVVISVFSAGAAIGADHHPMTLLITSPLIAIAILAAILVSVFIMVRFAAAPAMTVNTRRFVLLRSFDATRGVWGWMLLSYLGVMAMAMLGATIVSLFQTIAVLFAVSDLAGMASSLNSMGPGEVLAELAGNPFVIVALMVSLLLQVLFQVFIEASWHGVGAYAAVRHSGDAPVDEVIETPSRSVGDAPGEG